MIGLDTNVLVRYIVRDDPEQTKIATKFIESLSKDNAGFIASIVLCELDWVLKLSYNQNKDSRIQVLDGIISTSIFEVENLSSTIKALRAYKHGSADFADYMIRETAEEAGCKEVITFDQKALKYEGFKSPTIE